MSKITDFNWGQASAITITTTAETLIVTSYPVNFDHSPAHVNIEGLVMLTVGTAGATVTPKLYQGPAVSAAFLQWTGDAITVIAANKVVIPFQFEQDITLGGSLVYTLSLTVGSASGNSTADYANIRVFVS